MGGARSSVSIGWPPEVRSLLRARIGLVPFLVTILVVALATPALAGTGGSGSTRHRGRPAEVKLAREVRLGQFSQAEVTLWTRCKTPFVVQELVVDLTQVGGNSGSRAGDFGIVCDGAWHRLTLSVNTPDGGPFGPGFTRVTARLTVIDPATGIRLRRASTPSPTSSTPRSR